MELEGEGWEEDESFECCICQELLADPKQLADHLSKHGEENPDEAPPPQLAIERYLCGEDMPEKDLEGLWALSDRSCPLCDKKSKTLALLKAHYEKHFNVLFGCHCQKKFSSIKSLLSHAQSHPGPPSHHKAYLCLLCVSSFTEISAMKAHLAASPECGAKWTDDLNKSTQQEAKEVPVPSSQQCLTIANFTCALCQEAFKDWDTMSSHIEGHYNPKYTCTCQKEFTSEEAFESHSLAVHKTSRVAHTKIFNCSACSSTFSSIQNMENHLKLPFNIDCLNLWRTRLTISSSFPCQQCDEKFPKQGEVDSHTETHFNAQYICTCTSTFKSFQTFKIHCLHTHQLPPLSVDHSKTFTCIRCCGTFGDLSSIQEHLKKSQECHKKWKEDLSSLGPIKMELGRSIPDRLVPCSFCKKNFSSKILLEQHRETHYHATYICYCSVESSTLDEFGVHCLKDHNRMWFNVDHNKVFKCHCSKEFTSFLEIRDHLEESLSCQTLWVNDLNKLPPNDLLYPCPLCPKELTTKVSLKCHHEKHYNVHYTCHCSSYFKLFKSFETHCTLAHGQTPTRVDYKRTLVCPCCETRFETIEDLGVHLKGSRGCFKKWESDLLAVSLKASTAHDSKEHPCHLCKKSFDRKTQLRDHLETHYTVHYSCRQCPRVLTSKSNYRVHSVRAHKASLTRLEHDKKFLCAFCPKEFREVESIDRHSNLHRKRGDPERGAKSLGRKPKEFRCKECNTVFKSSMGYNRHSAYFKSKPMGCKVGRTKAGLQQAHTNEPLFIDVGSDDHDKEILLTSEVTIEPRSRQMTENVDPLCG